MDFTPDLLIFDCDGTLVNTERLNLMAEVEMIRCCTGLSYSIDEALEKFKGISLAGAVGMVEAEHKVRFPLDFADRYIEIVQRFAARYTRTIDGAHDFVGRARRAPDLKICVASNGEMPNIRRSLAHCDLLDFFVPGGGSPDYIFNATMVDRPKPAPDLFLHAAAQMGVAPHKALVIEDTIPGICAAVAAGIKVWGFTGAIDEEKEHIPAIEHAMRQAGADQIFADYSGLSAAFFASDLGDQSNNYMARL